MSARGSPLALLIGAPSAGSAALRVAADVDRDLGGHIAASTDHAARAAGARAFVRPVHNQLFTGGHSSPRCAVAGLAVMAPGAAIYIWASPINGGSTVLILPIIPRMREEHGSQVSSADTGQERETALHETRRATATPGTQRRRRGRR